MAIVDELKKLILSRGGQVAGVQTIADACAKLNEIESGIVNVLKGLTIVADFEATSEELLGKSLTDLQEDIIINPNSGEIKGTLKYVTGYTEFSGDAAEQTGHYLAIKCTVPDVTGVTIKHSRPGREVTLDSDGIVIYRVDNFVNYPFTVTAYKDGYTPVSRTFRIDNLNLAPAAS